MVKSKVLETYSDILPAKLLGEVDSVISKRKLSDSDSKKFVDAVVKEFNSSTIAPGESVGVICAESISEPATQMTLNTFHLAGVSEMNINSGLSRVIELVEGRKKIKTPITKIYLKAPHSSGKDIKDIALSIKETKLVEISRNISIDVSNKKIEVEVDPVRMDLFNVSRDETLENLSTGVKAVEVEFSGNILIFSVLTDLDLNSLYKLKNDIKEARVKGVKGISQVIPIKKGEEYFITATGSNFKKIVELEFVDRTRTITNDVYELSEVLGIEAARQHIVNEIKTEIIDNQGLALDMRHLLLIADTICASGIVKGMTRYGTVRDKGSALVRATFENTMKHLTGASITGEKDDIVSVIDNVMINQPIMMGTGFPELIAKSSSFVVDKSPKPKKVEKKEEKPVEKVEEKVEEEKVVAEEKPADPVQSESKEEVLSDE